MISRLVHIFVSCARDSRSPRRGLTLWKLRLTAIVLSCLAHAVATQAEKPLNWRIFRASDGLKDSLVVGVTVSPRGNIWVKHGESDEISVLDGYTVRTMPSPGRDNFRVYESRTFQLWSLYTNGLVAYDGKLWVPHPIAKVREEIQANVLRQVRQIPLIPVHQDRVYFLLPDKLMEYDSARKEVGVLKEVAGTGLGKFLEMSEARDGGIWITGTRGLAKVSGPLRQLNAASAWDIQLLHEQLQVENLQRPFEDDQGVVTTVATDSVSSNKRVLLRGKNRTWQKHTIEGEILRQAWAGWDQTPWGFTINSLLRFEGHDGLSATRVPIWRAQYHDVAVETNGVFWLGTSEGLIRCAPFLWQTPAEMEEVDSLVHAALEDSEGRLWFATSDFLVLLKDNQWRKIKWPAGFEADFQPSDGLYLLHDGRIAVAASNRPLVFDPATEQFRPVAHPANRRVRLIGAHKGGIVWAQTSEDSPGADEVLRLEHFDGASFSVWLDPVPSWALRGELAFAHESQNGDVWFGGSGGIGLYRNGRLRTFGAAQGFVVGRALCLLELPDGKIWCGGADKVLEFNGRRWSVLRAKLDRVSSMLRAKDGRIWVATGGGLFCYSEGSWVINGTEEGLPSAGVSKVLEDREGRIWAGSDRGISRYHPEADTNPPRTLEPRVNYPHTPSTEGPVILEFGATDQWQYTPPERLLFSYRLDEGQWSPFTDSMIQTLENMRAGKHRVEVRSMDRNWNVENSFASLEFSVVLPWYKERRLIAISMGGLALVLFFAGLAVNRHLRLVRSYTEVEKIVRQRTRELERANQELLQSQKMKALGTLAAGIAHDFNNILSIIKGSAQIIESHLEDKEKIRTRVHRIKTVVEQGSGIVKSMLGLSRVTPQDLVLCDLAAVVDDTLKLFGDRLLQELSFRFESEPEVPPVLGTQELIQQMLLNLILNGADAMMGKGEIVVRIGQVSELPGDLVLSPAPGAGYAYVAIQDSGCGIPREVLPRIFEPFFTTKAFSTRRGTGLGLSMVYELAKQLEYGLKVETTVGEGSIFTIFMPVRPPVASREERA
ncbi:MAG: hypothetical protein HY735_07595 [Verrucomicrobia bacterium]|nr:hypothetical protein [Verrucomicrobiota bacterium]